MALTKVGQYYRYNFVWHGRKVQRCTRLEDRHLLSRCEALPDYRELLIATMAECELRLADISRTKE